MLPACPVALQPGIQFQDVTTIMLNPVAFKHTIDMLAERYRGQRVDVVAGAPPLPRLVRTSSACLSTSRGLPAWLVGP